MFESRESQWNVLALVGPLAAFAIPLVGAGTRPLQGDDLATWYAATLSPRDVIRLIGQMDGAHGLHYLAMHYWIAAFGDSALSMRLPSIIAIAVAAVAIAFLGRRLVGRLEGILAALIFGLTPAMTHYGTEVRSYAVVIALTVISTILLYRALDRPTWLRWIGYGLMVYVTGILHFVSLLVLGAHLVAVAFSGKRKARRWYVIAVAIGLGMVPLLLTARSQAFAVAGNHLTGEKLVYYPTALTQSWQVRSFVLTFVIVGAILLWRTHRDIVCALVTWIVLPPVAAIAIFPIAPLFAPRYLAFTYPAWALLAGIGIVTTCGLLVQRHDQTGWLPRRVFVSVLLIMAVLGITGQIKVHDNRVIGGQDFVGAARYIQNHQNVGDAIVYGDRWPNMGAELARRYNRYAWRNAKAPADVFVVRTSRSVSRLDPVECATKDQCEPLVADAQRVWVETSDTLEGTLDGVPTGQALVVADGFAPVAVRSFRGIRLTLLGRVPEPG